MAFELRVPSVGESVTEVQMGEWLKQVGDWADLDEPLVVIESDKAAFELPSPVAGRITAIFKPNGAQCKVGDLIGTMEAAERPASAPEVKQVPAPAAPIKPFPTDAPHPGGPAFSQTPAAAQAPVMPAAARVLGEAGVPPPGSGTGPGGRVTKPDAVRAVEAARAGATAGVATPRGSEMRAAAAARSASAAPPAAGATARREEAVPMTLMRKRIAARLVEAQQTAALLTTFNEIDMSAVQALRAEHKEAFLERHGVKLGFMSFFVKAAVDALSRLPELNAEIRGDDIIYHQYHDIGVAVGGGRGLVVPVLRNAERLGFADIEHKIADFGRRAKENKLSLDDLTGGTFTITNGGVYGSLMSTPIVNPPQSGILGLHAIQERPVARAGQVVIRPMMYVALTYDHRVVDGREAVSFLVRIKEVVENPARLLLEI